MNHIDRTDSLGLGVDLRPAPQQRQLPPRQPRRRPGRNPRRSALMVVLAAVSTIAALLGVTALTSPTPASAEEGIFDQRMTPNSPADPDSNSVELGLRFSVTRPGTVVGVRFFGEPSSTRSNTGSLWSSSGERLATSTFPAADGLGWHSVTFDEPVQVRPGQTYVASYLAPAGGYIAKQHGFDAGATRNSVVSPPGAGVYKYGDRGGFPTDNWRNSNYFVDVRFVPGVATVPGPTLSPAPSSPAPTSTAPTSPAPSASATPSTSTPSAPPSSSTATPVPGSAYPNASNTGPKGTLTPRGGGTITTDGAVISNARVAGQLTIRADNVVVRNVHLTTSSLYGILSYGKNTVIEDTTIVGTPPATMAGLAATDGATIRARRINVSRVEDGVRLADNSLLADSYIHTLAGDSSSHYDGVTADGFTGWEITHNTIINSHGQTAAVWIGDPRYSPSEGILQRNWLAGGGYTLYAGPGTGAGLRVIDNVFSTEVHTRGGHWGPVTEWSGAGNTWSGNVWADGPNARQAVRP